jgi:gliding motility-associated lipoprotein GldH
LKNSFSSLVSYTSPDRYLIIRNACIRIIGAGPSDRYHVKRNAFIWVIRAGFFFLYLFFLNSCETIDLYEKNVVIPGHRWVSSFKPEFTFTIKDTTVPYQFYFTIRHNEKYHYNNIWINIYSQPLGDTVQILQKELLLATADKGWLGAGMDDIYEHRIELFPSTENLYFRKAGDYKFIIEHIMREDPLENVMNVGLRVEKKQ